MQNLRVANATLEDQLKEKTFLFQQEAKKAKNYYKDKTDYENKNKNLTYEKLEAV